MKFEQFYLSVLNFREKGNLVLSKYESSPSRKITIDSSYKRLQKLSLHQEELFQEAFNGIEFGIFRSSIVLAWAAFIDFLADKIGEDSFTKLNARKGWNVSSTDELREKASDSKIIECALELGLINKNTAKNLRGLLAKRNECGHPSEYKPGLNDTLGYIDELLKRIELL